MPQRHALGFWRGADVFRVTAANDDGVWNQEGRAVALVITPPWWATTWFRAAAALSALGAVLAVFRWRTLALRRRKRELEREVHERREVEKALRHTHARVQELAGQLIAAQEQERRRIARELHDDVNQQVAALSIALSALGTRLPEGTADLRAELARLEDNAQRLSEAVRGLSHGLHPAVLEHAGLVPALRGFCRENGGSYELTLSLPDGLGPVPAAAALCLYRAAQEALHNVAKHARAEHVRVAVEREDGHLALTVGDDGCGFDVEEARTRGGLGLVSLEERARLVGGRVSITSRPQHGTEVRILVPLEGH
jgi:two-component system sensor histidine kinase UhpB